jgi:segregation and condensation protein B
MTHVLSRNIEALVFASPQPVTREELLSVLQEVLDMPVSDGDVEEALSSIRNRYRDGDYAFELVEIAGGYQFMTKGAYHHAVSVFLRQTTKKRLSQAAMETLALVAYKQPVSKSELEEVRGVNCDYAIQKLLEKELVAIVGRSEGPGRPLLYGTSEKFMDYFGLRDLSELPKPKDFQEVGESIGVPPALEESTDSNPTDNLV